MTNFKFIAPVLHAVDLKTEIEFFEKLGFDMIYSSLQYSDTLDYAVMHRDGVTFHIQFQFEKDMPPENAGFQVRITLNDLDSLHKELEDKGFEINRRNGTDWGTDEFGFYSPAGNAIIFQQDQS